MCYINLEYPEDKEKETSRLVQNKCCRRNSGLEKCWRSKRSKNGLVNHVVLLEETVFVLTRKGLRRQHCKEQRRKICRTISVTNRKYLAKNGTNLYCRSPWNVCPSACSTVYGQTPRVPWKIFILRGK